MMFITLEAMFVASLCDGDIAHMSSELEELSSVVAVLDVLADEQPFGDVHVASESGPISMGIYAAMRPSPQLIFCLGGEATYWVRRRGVPAAISLKPGDCLVLPGGVWVALDPTTSYRTFGMSLFPEMLHCYLVEPGRPGEPHPTGGKSRTFNELNDNAVAPEVARSSPFERIDYLDELDRSSAPDQTADQLIAVLAQNAARSASDVFLKHVLKALIVRLRETVLAEQRHSSSKAEATFNRIRRFVIANCDQPLDRDEIAAAAGVHPRHVSNLFSKFSDITLSQFILNARLERAKRLLATSNSSVTEVSQICGFAGANHFVRVFRQRFGTPPGKYRNAAAPLSDHIL